MKASFTRTVTTSVDYDVVTVTPNKGIEILNHLHLADDIDTATKKEIEKKYSGKKIQFIESGRTEEKRYISYEDFMAHSMTEKDWNNRKSATAESTQASK
jgi:hypothetical protein